MKNIITIVGLVIIILFIIFLTIQLRKGDLVGVTPVDTTLDTNLSSDVSDADNADLTIFRTGALAEQVVIASPLVGSTIVSPVTVEATVPAGWVFEGDTPVEIYAMVEGERVLIGQGLLYAGEDWMSGNPIDVTGVISFTTTASSRDGLVVLPWHSAAGDDLFPPQEVAIPVVLNEVSL